MFTNTNNRLWIVGSAILTIAVLVMGWFLGVSPKLDEASNADQQRTQVEAQNVVHEQDVKTVKKQFEQLPALKGQLSIVRAAVPKDDDLSTFLGELHALEQANGVSLTTFTSADGRPYTPVKSTTASTVSTTNPLITPDNFVAIPVTLAVTGDQPSVMNFMQGLQNGDRLFLVTDFTLDQDKDDGMYTASISGFVYVLLDQASQPAKAPKASDAKAAPKG